MLDLVIPDSENAPRPVGQVSQPVLRAVPDRLGNLSYTALRRSTPLKTTPEVPETVSQAPPLEAPSTRVEPLDVHGRVAVPATPLAGYRLLSELARGGMGIVYRAHDEGLNRDVAVKVVKEEYRSSAVAVRRFIEEGQITGQLQHPAIPAVHQIGTLPDGSPFLAMKLIKGETLAAQLARPDHDRAALVATFQRVAEAVGYAHSRGVIHRDLKPANVMVGAFGEVQVMDWGLAKVLTSRERERPEPDLPVIGTVIDAGRPTDSETQAGSVMGTPAYMPPEQAGGELDKVDERSDVFGLGAVLCEVLTDDPPYRGRDAGAVRLMAVRGQLSDAFRRLDASGADPELVALAKRCLSPDRDHRPANGGAVAEAVAGLRAAAEERARQAELDRVRAEAEAREQAKRKRMVLAVGISLVSMVAVAGGAAWYVQKERTNREQAETERVRKEEELRRERDLAESRTRMSVDDILDDVRDFHQRARWDQALARLDEADRLIGPTDEFGLRARVTEARTNTVVLRRLDRIRLDRERGLTGSVNRLRVRRDYPLAFAESGFAVPDHESAASRMRASPIRDYLIGALDDWASAESGDVRAKIIAVADAVAGQTWRSRLVAAAAGGTNLAEWLAQVPEAERSPGLWLLAAQLTHEAEGNVVDVLEAGLRHYPSEFWLHLAFGEFGDVPADVLVGAYRTALAIRPETAVVHNNLGAALMAQGDWDDAAREFREAARLDPRLPRPRANLGALLAQLGDRAGAVRELEEAARLDPHSAATQDSLGIALDAQGDPAAAVRAYREATRIDPRHHVAHYNLGSALARLGDLDAAIIALRMATKLQPRNRVYQQTVARIERWQALLPRLPKLIAGRAQPTDATEALAFADLCAQPFQRRYALAVRLDLGAFTKSPALADDPDAGYRYEAANHAALAMAGRAVDLPTFDAIEWAYLSEMAHRWLRAELAATPSANVLQGWKADADLTAVRDAAWMAAMPVPDRERWARFWADVDTLLTKRP